jgi:Heterokaryon incompatibility protein (HET)
MLTYPPLLPFPAWRSTRLFTLFPGTHNDPIVGSLSSIGLGSIDSPTYEALSYTWGHDKHSIEITVDGHKHMIRRNLHQALIRVRLPTSPRPLWIDYLCIRQDDLDEKAAQVQIIGDIFFSAKRVLVWVGERADGSERLFRPWPAVQMERASGLRRLIDWSGPRIPKQELLRRAEIWASFFGRRYFTRTWIVQEIGKARTVIVHSGSDSMDWKQFISDRTRASDDFYFDGLKLTRTGDQDAIWRLTGVWVQVKTLDALMRNLGDESYGMGHPNEMSRNGSIFDFMERFQETRCYDPRDQVFALRSLDHSGGNTKFTVDYNIRLPDLVVMLYDTRYVNWSFPIQPLPGSKHIPSPTTIILALRMSAVQCEEAVAMMEGRKKAVEGDKARKRWEEVIWLFKDEASDFASYYKDRLPWWSHPDPDHLDFDEADSDNDV